MRRAARILGLIVAVAVIAVVGVRLYLASNAAKQLAAGKLSEMLGGRVVVTHLNAGLLGSTGIGVEIPARPAAPTDVPPDGPIFTGRLVANASAAGLAVGRLPTAITVEDAVLTLRFDAAGNLLDELPEPKDSGGGSLPAVTVTGGTVRIFQTGRPEFRVTGIGGTLTAENGRLILTGRADDSTWGQWAACGEAAADGSTAQVTLALEGVRRVGMEQLRSLPGVSPSVWKAVELEGETAATVAFRRTADGFSYRIDLEPRNTNLTLPTVGLSFANAAAKVGIEGDTVTLTGFRGQTAGGEVTADGVGDFAADPETVTLTVKAKGLDVNRLPKKWNLPPVEEGRLRGSADLTLKVRGDDIETHGRGKGVIDMKVLGGTGELEIRLVGDGKKLEFQGPAEKTSHIPRPQAPFGDAREASSAGRSYGTDRPRDPAQEPNAKQSLATRVLFLVAAVLLQPPAAPAEPPATDPTVVKANLRLRDVDLAELVAKLNIDLPIRLAGKVSVDVAAEIPLTQARSLKAYKVRGKITVPNLDIQDLNLKDALADINLDKGVLTLTQLSATVPENGRVVGSARFAVEPRGDLVADLKLTAVSLGEVFQAVPSLSGKASGPVSGELTFRLPGDKLNDIAAAVADGSLTSPGLTLFGRAVGATKLTLKLRDGIARIADASTKVEGLALTGSASLTLADNYPFEADVSTKPTDIANFTKLAPPGSVPVEVRGKVELTAKAAGGLNPLTYSLGGKADAAELRVGTAAVDRLAFAYTLTDRAVALSDIKAEAFKGVATGSATIPLRAADAGEFRVELKDLDASTLTRTVPSLPINLEGRLGGTVAGTLPPAADGKARQATVNLDVQAPRLRVQGIPTSRLTGTVDYKPGELIYKLKGDALGGSFDLDGTYPLANQQERPKDAVPPESGGSLRVDGALLERLADALSVPALAPLRGKVILAVRYRYDAEGRGPFGDGRLQVIDFGWADGRYDRSDILATVRVNPQAVDIADLTGRLAGGDLRGRARYNLTNPDRSFFNASLDRADAPRLLAPFGVAAPKGLLSVAVRGTFGREIRGTGTVGAARSDLGLTSLADVRVPFEFHFAPGGQGELRVRDANAHLAGGRVRGQAVYRWGWESRFEGDLRFTNVSVRQITGISAGITPGRANGQFTFAGRNVRSLNDVTGMLTATYGETNPFDAPVLRQIAPFLNPTQPIAPFSEGDVRARLVGGRLNVERFTLTSANLRLFASGTLWLTGRIELDVKARTGQVGADFGALRLFGLRIPAVGPLPLTLVMEISRFLSNRMVLLRVSGTVDQPSVQVNVAALLADETIRYFLGIDILRFAP